MTPSQTGAPTGSQVGPRRQRSRRGDGDLLRAEILDAAAALLAERGDEAAVSIRAVADAVGVTAPSIYLHFPDKDALITAVCEARWAEFDALIESAAATSTDPLHSLRLRGAAYVRFGLDHPEHYRVLFMTRREHGLDDEDHVAGRLAFEHLVAAVSRCVDAGVMPAVDPMRTSFEVWALVHGLTSLLISLPAMPWPPVDALVGDAMDHLLAGLRP